MEKAKQQWLFTECIDGHTSWARVYQSIKDFEPIVREIFRLHHLEPGKVENLTPGTNAVFRVGDKVVKIFAPIESGYYTDNDYAVELAALRHANRVEVTAPLLVCTGCMEDKYLFRYIVMEHIQGCEFEGISKHFSHRQKVEFAAKLKAITQKLNVELLDNNIPEFSLHRCLENAGWHAFPESFRQSRTAFVSSQSFSKHVYTHGDLTGENIIVNDNGDVFIIDFADSRLAPFYYEWPPIVFALFGCDVAMMGTYFGEYHHQDFYDKLTLGMVIHEFGATLVQQICDMSGVAINTVTDMSQLKALLEKSINSGHMKVR